MKVSTKNKRTLKELSTSIQLNKGLMKMQTGSRYHGPSVGNMIVRTFKGTGRLLGKGWHAMFH